MSDQMKTVAPCPTCGCTRARVIVNVKRRNDWRRYECGLSMVYDVTPGYARANQWVQDGPCRGLVAQVVSPVPPSEPV